MKKPVCQIPPDAQCAVAKAVIPYLAHNGQDRWNIKSLFDVFLRGKWKYLEDTHVEDTRHDFYQLKYGKQDWTFRYTMKTRKWSCTGHGTDLR